MRRRLLCSAARECGWWSPRRSMTRCRLGSEAQARRFPACRAAMPPAAITDLTARTTGDPVGVPIARSVRERKFRMASGSSPVRSPRRRVRLHRAPPPCGREKNLEPHRSRSSKRVEGIRNGLTRGLNSSDVVASRRTACAWPAWICPLDAARVVRFHAARHWLPCPSAAAALAEKSR